MDTDNEVTEPSFSESILEFVNSHSIEELYDIVKDLDKKVLAAKESKEMAENGIEELQQSISNVHNQRLDSQSQTVELQKQIESFREQLKVANAEKAVASQAETQRQKKDTKSTLSLEQQKELSKKFDEHCKRFNELQDRAETLESQKAEHQQAYANFHLILNERNHELELITEQMEEEQKRKELVQQKFEELRGNVEGLCADIQRLKHKLANPTQDESDGGKSLFEQIVADKKSLEAELVNLIELTSVFRQQIRQKQEELEELEAHEHESLMHNVDMEYVLSKMRFLAKDDDVVCMGLGEIESKFNGFIKSVEELITDKDGKPLELSNQYKTLRDYSLDCLKVVKRECVQGLLALKARFTEFEQLANDYVDLQERISQAAKTA